MRRVAERGEVVKMLVLEADERLYVGLDVHKHTYHVAVWSDRRRLLKTWIMPADAEALCRKLEPWRAQVVQVVYEAGPTGYSLVRKLRATRFRADVIAPSKLPKPAVPQAKSDRIDCRRLAELAAKNMLYPVMVPDEEEEADRQVVRLRGQLLRRSRAVRQQIKSLLLQHGIAEPAGLAHWSQESLRELRALELRSELRFSLDVLQDELEHVIAQLVRVTAQIREMEQSDRHRADVSTLRTIPGVGLITAMTFKTELLAPERFRDTREVALMLGLAPQVEESGQTRREGRLAPSGNRRLRAALVEGAWCWVRRDPEAAARYRRLAFTTASPKKAIVGMARKLGIIMWRMLTNGEKYRGFKAKEPARAG